MYPWLVSARGSAGPGRGSCQTWMLARRGAGDPGPVTFTLTVTLSPGPGPGSCWAELLLQRTLANASHNLDDCGQFISASATPVPARPSRGEGPKSGDLLRGAARGGKERRHDLDMVCKILRWRFASRRPVLIQAFQCCLILQDFSHPLFPSRPYSRYYFTNIHLLVHIE